MRHRAIISGNKADLGEVGDVQHLIDTGDHAPIRVVISYRKKKLTTAPLLPYPRHDLKFILHTNAKI